MQSIAMQRRQAWATRGMGQPDREAANGRMPLASSKQPGLGDTLHDRQQEFPYTILIYHIFKGLSRNMCVMSVLF
jgi:hypothetical protein